MVNKSKIKAALVMNIIIFAVTLGIVISYFFGNTSAYRQNGLESFRFFTTDSNILSMLASLVVSIHEIQILRGKNARIPHGVMLFKFVAAVPFMVTFCAVMVFLGPIYGYPFLLSGSAFHMHFVGPMLALISLGILENFDLISVKESLLGILPVTVYGAVYLTEVVLIGEKNGGWYDFYAFNRGGRWYLTVIIMHIATLVICLLVRFLHNFFVKKEERK